MTLETDDTMGMSSVTEAPRWRHEARAARTEPQLFSSRMGRLELVSADASQLVFSGRRRALAPVILSPLLVALSALPWLAPQPRTVLHVGTSFAFGLAASCLAAWCWPRRRRVHVVSREPAPRGARVVPPGTVRWVLVTTPPEGAARAGYAAALRTGDGVEHAVLASTDPERLLRQLAEVLRHWPGPVECRWGLPASARPWSIEPQSGPRSVSAAPARPILRSSIASRPLRWCTVITTLLVLVDLVLLVGSASSKLSSVHPLSVVLAVLFELYLVVLTLALATGEGRLTFAGRLLKERSIFGLRRAVGDVRAESVRGVYAIGAPGADRWHVLVDSADGPLSVSVERAEAQALAREAERALALARSAG